MRGEVPRTRRQQRGSGDGPGKDLSRGGLASAQTSPATPSLPGNHRVPQAVHRELHNHRQATNHLNQLGRRMAME